MLVSGVPAIDEVVAARNERRVVAQIQRKPGKYIPVNTKRPGPVKFTSPGRDQVFTWGF